MSLSDFMKATIHRVNSVRKSHWSILHQSSIIFVSKQIELATSRHLHRAIGERPGAAGGGCCGWRRMWTRERRMRPARRPRGARRGAVRRAGREAANPYGGVGVARVEPANPCGGVGMAHVEAAADGSRRRSRGRRIEGSFVCFLSLSFFLGKQSP